MGNCCSSNDTLSLNSYAIPWAIKNTQLDRLNKFYSLSQKKSTPIDAVIMTAHNIRFNALGYALWIGNADCFKYLMDNFHASILEMEKLFHESDRTGVHIICEAGFEKILQLYLPHYMEEVRVVYPFYQFELPAEAGEDEATFDATINENAKNPAENIDITATFSPCQIACEKGRISCVKVIRNFFNHLPPPFEFDFNYVCEATGENCALIAVRTGNLRLVQYLHKKTNANFRLVNKRDETVLQIAVFWAKRCPRLPYFDIVKYLIKDIKIDFTINYEETLLLCDNKQIIEYLENALNTTGINTSKKSIEQANHITSAKMPINDLERRMQMYDGQSKFEFREFYQQFGKAQDFSMDHTEISSIYPMGDNKSQSEIGYSVTYDELFSQKDWQNTPKPKVIFYLCKFYIKMERLKGVSIMKPISYGSVSFYQGKKAEEHNSHKWACYLRSPIGEDLSTFIKKIVFHLHPSFPDPVRTVEQPPFEIQETGWGEFEMMISVYFQDSREKRLDIYHIIKLHPSHPGASLSTKRPVVNENYDEVVFTDPYPDFYERLKNSHVGGEETLNQLDPQFHADIIAHYIRQPLPYFPLTPNIKIIVMCRFVNSQKMCSSI